MKIIVDRELCVGIGNCVVNACAADEEKIMEAAESCPVNAITVEDDEGQQLYP
jgi:ferredoxin